MDKTDIRYGYKFFTHDLRSPIQGGLPVWDGSLPFDLPRVDIDESENECGAGWNYIKDIETGFRIVGMWPTGRPVRIFEVFATGKAVERGDKRRTGVLQIVRECNGEEIFQAMQRFSTVFTGCEEEMAVQQWRWFNALARPLHSESKVREGLAVALEKRGLGWHIKRYDSVNEAWAARDVGVAGAAWAARDAVAAGAAWAALAAWAAGDAWAARAARDAVVAGAARAAGAAWDAGDALILYFSAKRGWVAYDPMLLTDGLRDAYRNGLEIAFPTGPNELGYVMKGAR